MNYFKNMTLALIATTLIGSWSVGAQEERDPVIGFAGDRVYTSTGRRDVFKRPNFLPTWKLDVKLALLKDVGILGDDLKTGKFNFIQDIFSSFKHLPEAVTRIYMYGDGRSKNTTMLVFGNIGDSWLENYVVKHLYDKKHQNVKYSKKVLRSGLKDITKLTFHTVTEQKERSIYFSTVNSGIYVISSNMIEIRRWRDYPRSVLYWRWPNAHTLFSLQMRIESTLINIQKDGGKDVYMLQSKIFKDAEGINIAIKEDDDEIYIGSYITTKNPSQTEELKALLTQMLVNSNPESKKGVKRALLENLGIKREGNYLKMDSIIPKSIFK